MDEIELSIIVPVYNVEKYLPRCVDSLLAQPPAHCEIILVNDGSTDHSGDICRSYAERYEFISVITKENGGLASARNAGLDAAKGRYVSFLDSDDWMRAGSYALLLSVVSACAPDVIGFGCCRTTDTAVYGKDHPLWDEGLHTGESLRQIQQDILTNKELFDFKVIRSSCMHLFKKALIDRLSLRFLSERIILNEDYLFVATAVTNAKSYYCCKEALYYYYTRKNSLTTRYLTQMFARKSSLMREYDALAARVGFSEEQEYRLAIFYLNNCYECLANECGAERPELAKVKEILTDDRLHRCISSVRMDEQDLKAKIFLFCMKTRNAHLYLLLYRPFRFVKQLRLRFRKRVKVGSR